MYDTWFWIFLVVLVLWELLMKGVGLWHSAKNGHKRWFIAILILNTMGILPFIYVKYFQGSKKKHAKK